MSKQVGLQLMAPEGYAELRAEVRYYFLVSDAVRERVLLVSFEHRPPRLKKTAQGDKMLTPWPRPRVVALNRARFESALLHKRIVQCVEQYDLPPWLHGIPSRDLAGHELSRRGGSQKRTHAERIDRILVHIWGLVQNAHEVLAAESPDQVINAAARCCRPRQNELRMRVWFYTYLLFGRKPVALHYPIHRIGRWERSKHPDKKFGRPSRYRGSQHGHSSCDEQMQADILRAYRTFSGPGKTMAAIYDEAMTRLFGCRSSLDGRRRRYLWHPAGLPFPNLRQFRYRVEQHFGLAEIQRIRFGEQRSRNRLRAWKGHYSENLTNLMQQTEADAYVLKDHPRGYLDDVPLPKLRVIRIRCVTSGAFGGIGFSLGSEKAEAYRAALFCCFVEKTTFCRLFGISLEEGEWPIQVGPAAFAVDRGAGSVAFKEVDDAVGELIAESIAPSWTGQSKATIESSNPSSDHLEGQPHFQRSRATVVELAVREICRTIADNDSIDVSDRLDADMLAADVKPTPLGIWAYLEERMRTDGLRMDFDTAVRTFLTPIELDLRHDGVYFKEARFYSDAFADSGVMDRVATQQASKVRGYMLSACVRYLWVECEAAGLIEVAAMRRIAGPEGVLWVSVADLAQSAELLRRARAELEVHRRAVQSRMHERFKELTGKAFDSRRRQPGKARLRTEEGLQQTEEAQRFTNPTRAKRRA